LAASDLDGAHEGGLCPACVGWLVLQQKLADQAVQLGVMPALSAPLCLDELVIQDGKRGIDLALTCFGFGDQCREKRLKKTKTRLIDDCVTLAYPRCPGPLIACPPPRPPLKYCACSELHWQTVLAAETNDCFRMRPGSPGVATHRFEKTLPNVCVADGRDVPALRGLRDRLLGARPRPIDLAKRPECGGETDTSSNARLFRRTGMRDRDLALGRKGPVPDRDAPEHR
jgi:hypothetical protein